MALFLLELSWSPASPRAVTVQAVPGDPPAVSSGVDMVYNHDTVINTEHC